VFISRSVDGHLLNIITGVIKQSRYRAGLEAVNKNIPASTNILDDSDNNIRHVEGSCKERNRQLPHSAQPIRTISVEDVFGYLRRDPQIRMSLVTAFLSKHVENGHI